MGFEASFHVLSRIVDQFESGGRSVRHVEATAGDERESLDVVLEAPVSFCEATGEGVAASLTPERASLTNCDGLVVEFSTASLMTLSPETAAAVSDRDQAVHVEDGSLVLTLEFTIDPPEDSAIGNGPTESASETELTGTEHGGEPGGETPTDERASERIDRPDDERSCVSSPTDDRPNGGQTNESHESEDVRDVDDALAAVRDESLRPYEDVPYLERLYELCDTFTEMSEAIAMDVSSETVRRYMIEAGVHDPASYDVVDGTETPDDDRTNGTETVPQTPDGADESIDDINTGELLTDGAGLPESVRIEDVADAVVESMTVYEVSQRLGLERQETKDLLRDLNLIDITMRRVDDDPEGGVSYQEVAERVHQCEPNRV